jgi:subtilase family serine protease
MQIVAVGPSNFFVRARGTVANAQAAFHVTISKFEVNGQTFRSNTGDPYVDGAAGALVRTVAGLDNQQYTHPIMSQASVLGKAPAKRTQAAAASASDSSFYTSNCFTGTKTETFTTGGSIPIGTYKGNSYNGGGNVLGCGYTPPEIQAAYNLTGLYKEGYDGTGQTIVIVDWCGSTTITQDANAFSTKFGLPALTAKNFSIVEYPTPSQCAAPGQVEINLDVEWAHAVAPGASILLLVPPSATFADTDAAVFYAANYQLGNVISGSYGAPESLIAPTTLETENLISEVAAVMGVSTNYSSGDGGDYVADGIPATVIAPADSPYATAVGGVAAALNSSNGIEFQVGWGNNATILSDVSAFDPPQNFGFQGGSGGGPSGFFAKPAYQAKLPGTTRQLPDIAWLADPYTGGVIAITEPGVFPPVEYQVWGGTSLACPMFSALWAIANQEAGTPLGQAAPYLYYMPKGTITDIVPQGSYTNVTGWVKDSQGTTNYCASCLAAPLENSQAFYSALWDVPLYPDLTYVITFGTDSGLATAWGWDNVTGVGVPNPKAFADFFK